MTLADARHIWTDRDRPELARADAFVAWLDALPEPREAMGAASELVDLLNEPLTILPRLRMPPSPTSPSTTASSPKSAE